MNIQAGKELADACIDLAKNRKTLYVYGCFGAPMNEKNKSRYISSQPYNAKPDREYKIRSASSDTFGFDCVGMIKGLLWDWDGKPEHTVYGGADYCKNGIKDFSANSLIADCEDVSTDFSALCVGEALWMQDHIGVYIGDGFCVECTPRWKDGCQITAVHNIGRKNGYNGRAWTKHGKIRYITYDKPTAPVGYTHEQFVKDVQKSCGAMVDGIPGPETMSKVPVLSAHANNTHDAVLAVQKYLLSLGYEEIGNPDGMAGVRFTSAVAHYQTDRFVDGIIGNDTWEKLLEVK